MTSEQEQEKRKSYVKSRLLSIQEDIRRADENLDNRVRRAVREHRTKMNLVRREHEILTREYWDLIGDTDEDKA